MGRKILVALINIAVGLFTAYMSPLEKVPRLKFNIHSFFDIL